MGIVYGKGVRHPVYKKEMALSDLAPGTILVIPFADNTLQRFFVCVHDYEPKLNGNGRSLLTLEKMYGDKGTAFNASRKAVYAGSDIDNLCVNDFFMRFSEKLKRAIGQTSFYYNFDSSSPEVISLTRSAFLLSATEAGAEKVRPDFTPLKQGTVLPMYEKLYLLPPQTAVWTRTPATPRAEIWYGTTTDGELWANAMNSNFDFSYARPSFTLPGQSLVNPEPNSDGSYNLIV